MLENDNLTVLIVSPFIIKTLHASKIRKKKKKEAKMILAVELGAEPPHLQITAGPKAESFKANPTSPFGWLKSLLLSLKITLKRK